MPVTLPPVSADTLAELRGGDEHALERVFRDTYSPLTQEAMEVLHNAASAGHAVEAVFVRVWNERARFQTPEELEEFLHREVRQDAARRESRHAVLQHFNTPGGHGHKHTAATVPPPVDEAWGRVESALHAPHLDAESRAHVVADHSRHEAAAHVAAIGKRPSWVLPAALVVLFTAGIILLIRWLDTASVDSAAAAAIASPNARELSTPVGQLAEVTLGDGSRVMLGPDSRVRVPAGFGDEVRAVGLEGTASFTVAPGGTREFGVHAGSALIKATGTEFSVRAYPDENVTVRVASGQVTVTAGKEVRPLEPGRALTVAGTDIREPSASELEEALGWVDGQVIVNNKPLRAVLHEFTRWYGLDLQVQDSALLDQPVTMRASRSSTEEALAALEQSTGRRFGYARHTPGKQAAPPRPR